MEPLDIEKVAADYNNRSVIWPKTDKWHQWTYKSIREFVQRRFNPLETDIILNAGSGGNDYGVRCDTMYHMDIASEKINDFKHKIVGSIESIPIGSNFFDKILCVGSVINYCDPVVVFNEFKRTLKQEGELVVEFESSYTLELIGSHNLNKKMVKMHTFYNGEEHILWYYSERFIKNILYELGFDILTIYRFHILSPLFYKISRNEQLSAYIGKIDPVMRWIPLLRKFASNVIIHAKSR